MSTGAYLYEILTKDRGSDDERNTTAAHANTCTLGERFQNFESEFGETFSLAGDEVIPLISRLGNLTLPSSIAHCRSFV